MPTLHLKPCEHTNGKFFYKIAEDKDMIALVLVGPTIYNTAAEALVAAEEQGHRLFAAAKAQKDRVDKLSSVYGVKRQVPYLARKFI